MPVSSTSIWFRFVTSFVRKHLEGRTSLHVIIHNTGWLLGDKVLRLGMGLIVGAWVARYLGPSQYGELSYVLAFVAFFQIISQLGLDGIAIRDMARNRQASSVILGTVFRLRLITGFLCWLSATGAMVLFRPGDINALILTAIISGSLVFQAADSVDLWFQSQTQSRRTVVSKAISCVINNLFKIILINIKASLVYFAVAGLFEIMISAIALYYSYKKYPAPFRWVSDIKCSKLLLKESWPYMLSGLAIIIYMRIDQIMLRQMLGTRELGIFSAALPLSVTWYFIPMIISQSAGPSLAKKKQSDPIGYEQSIERLFSLMWWISLPLSLTISFLSSPIVKLLYGNEYAASASVLAIHVFANIPVSLGIIQSIWILNEGRNTISLIKTVIGAVANVVLNYFMIPKYGAMGAAFATVVGQFFSAILSNIILAPQIFRSQIFGLIRVKSLLLM